MAYPRHIVAAGAFVKNEDGKYLMVKTERRGWEGPGGQVEIGEDLIQSVEREVEEESGIIVSVGKLIGVYSNITTGKVYSDGTPIPTIVNFVFFADKISGELRTSNETAEVGWFSKDELLSIVTEPMTVDRVKDMLNYDGNVVYRSYTKNPYEIHRECNI